MDCAYESSSLLNLFTLIKMLGTYYLWNQHLEARLGIGIGINELLKIVFYKNCKKLSREIYEDRIRLGLNRGVGVLLSTTSFILDQGIVIINYKGKCRSNSSSNCNVTLKMYPLYHRWCTNVNYKPNWG